MSAGALSDCQRHPTGAGPASTGPSEHPVRDRSSGGLQNRSGVQVQLCCRNTL